MEIKEMDDGKSVVSTFIYFICAVFFNIKDLKTRNIS